MMAISELTGLPELPEHHFWRIAEKTPEYFKGDASELIVYVYIMQRFEATTFVRAGVFGRRRKKLVSPYERVMVSVPVYGIINSVQTKLTIDEVHADDILEACVEALRIFKNRSLTRAYLGDFPPKKFGGD